MQNDIRPVRVVKPMQNPVAKTSPALEPVRSQPMQRTGSDNTFSRFIHTPVVEELHEVSHLTIARPSIVSGASIIASMSILFALFAGSYIGFTVSPYFPVAMLALGALAGLFFEATVVALQRLRS